MKGVFGKVVWVGRATVFLVGVAVILALVFGVASTAFAHGGYKGLLHLGHSQTARATTLVGNILDATKSALILQNTGGGSALELQDFENATATCAAAGRRLPTSTEASAWPGNRAPNSNLAHGTPSGPATSETYRLRPLR